MLGLISVRISLTSDFRNQSEISHLLPSAYQTIRLDLESLQSDAFPAET